MNKLLNSTTECNTEVSLVDSNLPAVTVCGSSANCLVRSPRGLSCDCLDHGWVASSEFFVPEHFALLDGVSVPVIPCNTNIVAQGFLYSLCIFFVIIALLAYSCSIKRFSQFKRLIPSYLTYLCFLVIPLLRLIDIRQQKQNRDIGEDAVTTIFFSVCIVLSILTLHVYLNKYINYHCKTLKIKSVQMKAIVKRSSKILSGNTIFSLFGAMIICIPLVVETSLKQRAVLFLISFFIGGLTTICILYFNRLLLKKLKQDIQNLDNVALSGKDKSRTIFNINGVQYAAHVYLGFNVIYFFLGTISFTTLELWRYFVPGMILNSTLSSIQVLYFNKRAKRKRLTPRPLAGNRDDASKSGISYRRNKFSFNRTNVSHSSLQTKSEVAACTSQPKMNEKDHSGFLSI